MSRIGLAPILLPKGVTATVSPGEVVVEGPKGKLTLTVPSGINIKGAADRLLISLVANSGADDALHGFVRAQLANLVTGVDKGWTRSLEMNGVGYRVAMSGVNLTLTVGFSHPVIVTPPQGIIFAVADGKIVVSGIDKQVVGQTAATIRAVKPPEPYKGKGIRYAGEVVRKKAGKSAKSATGAAATK